MRLGVECLRRVPVLLALLCFCAAAAAESVVVERDSELLAAPRADAPVVAKLRRGATGETLARQGAWVNLKTSAGTGWVMSFNVRYGAVEQAAPASTPGAGLGRLLSPRQKPVTTATIGIRGLEEEDLKRASVDPHQLRLLDSFAVSKQDAEQAARASGLSAERVEYLAQ